MNFDTILAPLRQLWLQQTPREQRLLVLLAGLVAVLLIWFTVLGPALSWRNEMRTSYTAQVEDHLQIVSGIERYRALAAAGQASEEAAAPLRTLIAARARESELAITRVQPLEDGQLGVWSDRVSETRLMAFLLALAADDGVRVTRLSLDREGESMVRAQMVLARSGGGA